MLLYLCIELDNPLCFFQHPLLAIVLRYHARFWFVPPTNAHTLMCQIVSLNTSTSLDMANKRIPIEFSFDSENFSCQLYVPVTYWMLQPRDGFEGGGGGGSFGSLKNPTHPPQIMNNYSPWQHRGSKNNLPFFLHYWCIWGPNSRFYILFWVLQFTERKIQHVEYYDMTDS